MGSNKRYRADHEELHPMRLVRPQRAMSSTKLQAVALGRVDLGMIFPSNARYEH